MYFTYYLYIYMQNFSTMLDKVLRKNIKEKMENWKT